MRSGNQDRIAFWIRDTDNHLHSIGQSLGFSYEEGAVVPDGTVARRHLTALLQAERPAGRALPASLARPRAQQLHAGLVRPGLRAGGRPAGDAWLEAARNVSASSACPQAAPIAQDPSPRRPAVGLRGAVLVRPDGHVAWRMPWTPADPAPNWRACWPLLDWSTSDAPHRCERHLDLLQVSGTGPCRRTESPRRRGDSLECSTAVRTHLPAFHRHHLRQRFWHTPSIGALPTTQLSRAIRQHHSVALDQPPHVFGTSLSRMIAQVIATRRPSGSTVWCCRAPFAQRDARTSVSRSSRLAAADLRHGSRITSTSFQHAHRRHSRSRRRFQRQGRLPTRAASAPAFLAPKRCSSIATISAPTLVTVAPTTAGPTASHASRWRTRSPNREA